MKIGAYAVSVEVFVKETSKTIELRLYLAPVA